MTCHQDYFTFFYMCSFKFNSYYIVRVVGWCVYSLIYCFFKRTTSISCHSWLKCCLVSVHVLYMHESLEPTSRKRKNKQKKHSSIFIFRGWMLIREGRKRGSEKRHQKWGKRRESEERGKERNERGGARLVWGGGGWVGSSAIRESGRKKCSVMRVLPLSEPEREKGRNHTNLSLDGGEGTGRRGVLAPLLLLYKKPSLRIRHHKLTTHTHTHTQI